MSKPSYYKTLSGPQIFVWRMFLFIVLIGLIVVIFNQKILELVNFSSSTPLKFLIAGVLGFSSLSGTAAWIAKVLLVIFLVLFVVSLLRGCAALMPVLESEH